MSFVEQIDGGKWAKPSIFALYYKRGNISTIIWDEMVPIDKNYRKRNADGGRDVQTPNIRAAKPARGGAPPAGEEPVAGALALEAPRAWSDLSGPAISRSARGERVRPPVRRGPPPEGRGRGPGAVPPAAPGRALRRAESPVPPSRTCASKTSRRDSRPARRPGG